MAKTQPEEVAPTSTPRPARRAASPPGPRLVLAYRAVKLFAFVIGFAATVIGLSASIGAFTENGYARFLGALVATIAVPLLVADRLLPKDDAQRAPGLVTDVMAVTWLVFGFGFAAAAASVTSGMLVREGDRYQRAGYEWIARAAYFFGGVTPDIPQAVAAPGPSSTASASASATSSTTSSPSTSASTTASASASATASASASASAAPKTDRAERSPAELFKELAPAVVTIFVKSRDGSMEGGGTGFVLDKAGTIVTNHHVIDGATSIKIKLYSGTSYTELDVLAEDPRMDLALLKIDPSKPAEGAFTELTAVTLGDSDTVIVGERILSIGNPLGLEHTLTDGLVSARRIWESRPWIQMSVPVSPGNSGGPVFSLRGEVLGVTTAQLGGAFGRAQNLNLAVPVNELKKLLKPEYPNRRRIGESANGGRW